jgi:type I restriction enzyme S subunit
MEEWKEYKLGDVSQIKGGKRLPKGVNLITSPNCHPYIRVRDLGTKKTIELNTSFEYVDEETQKSISKYTVEKGDIIISIVGTIGLVAIIGDSLNNANLTENCVKIVNSNTLNREYLYYYLISKFGQYEIKNGTVGAVQAKLPIKNIQDIKVKAPSLSEQTKIASVLKSLDDKIEVNRRINDNLEQQAQALFKSWFVDFEPFKDGEFVETELGRIPKGWRVGTLGDIVEISKNSINPQKLPQTIFNHYSIPAFDEEMKPEIQLGEDIKSNKFVIMNKMTLFSKLNPRIKRVWYVDQIKPNSICSTEFVPFKAKDEAQSSFIYSMINSQGFYEYIMSMVNGATGSHQRFHPEESLSYNIAINNECVGKYSEVINPIIDQILNNRKESRRLATLRDTLLPRLMSGELKVNDIENAS